MRAAAAMTISPALAPTRRRVERLETPRGIRLERYARARRPRRGRQSRSRARFLNPRRQEGAKMTGVRPGEVRTY
jgi:hypothetical protein